MSQWLLNISLDKWHYNPLLLSLSCPIEPKSERKLCVSRKIASAEKERILFKIFFFNAWKRWVENSLSVNYLDLCVKSGCLKSRFFVHCEGTQNVNSFGNQLRQFRSWQMKLSNTSSMQFISLINAKFLVRHHCEMSSFIFKVSI